MLSTTARLSACALLVGCVLGVACAKPAGGADTGNTAGDDTDDDDAAGRREAIKQKPLTIDERMSLRALEAENAALKRQLEGGASADAYTGLINAHEHLYKLKDLERYLPAARRANIKSTVLVASPEFTIMGKGDKGEPYMSENFKTLLEAAKAYPGEIIPFATIDPKDPKKLERLKEHVAQGAKGLKIYSGHSNFYDGALARDDMDPVFAYLEETGLPINWHINLSKFMGDFERVMKAHPKLNVMVPHYGVAFWRPNGDTLAKMSAMMKAYPSLYVDTSLGTREILLDGMSVMESATEKFKQFFADNQDRIVWGTDSVITGNVEKTPGWYHKVIYATRDHLEKEVFATELAAGYSRYWKKNRDAEGRYKGLGLSPEILEKVYVKNAQRWLRLSE